MRTLHGRCACGKVSYEARVEYLHRRFCHCLLCRELPGHRVVTGLAVPRAGLHWHAAAPVVYEDGSRMSRAVCGACGSSMITWEPGGSLAELDAVTLGDDCVIGCRSHVLAMARVPFAGVGAVLAG